MGAVDGDLLRSLAQEVMSLRNPGDKEEISADIREVADGKW